MKRGFVWPVLLAALVWGTGAAGAGSLMGDGSIAADCDGFTLTFYGGFFLPGETQKIGYVITLETETETILYMDDGTLTMSHGQCDVPEWSNCDPYRPSVVVHPPWGREICGANAIFSGGAAPDGEYIASDPANPDVLYRVGGFLFDSGNNWSELACDCEALVEVCRGPGFWGSHSGTEKKGDTNITQAVLDAVNGAWVCGQPIQLTSTGDQDSALEALCVSPKGDKKLQLARQLTAAALNCVMSGGGAECDDVSIEAMFEACNDACLGLVPAPTIGECIDAIDCFNNGGVMLENGLCQIGTCDGDGETACEDDRDCEHRGGRKPHSSCVPTPGNCQERPLVCDLDGDGELDLDFEPPGPAGSSKSCHKAEKNKCTIFGGC